MGGRGTFAAGNQVAYTYQTVDQIEDVKVLEGLGGKHGLPEEAHSSTAYIKLKPDGTFHEMRMYDKDHYLVKEIAYHPEPNLNNGNRYENILHAHEYVKRQIAVGSNGGLKSVVSKPARHNPVGECAFSSAKRRTPA